MKRTLKGLKIQFGECDGQKLVPTSAQNKFLDELSKESDRSAVLTTVAIFDEMMKAQLQHHFNKGNSKTRDALYGFNGPFGTLSSKIDALFCLGFLSKDQHSDLTVLRKLRNICAHHWDTFTFDDKVEKQYIDKVQNYILLDQPDLPTDFNEYCCKTRFMFIVAYYLITLNLLRRPSSLTTSSFLTC